jgi:hypothetical protein
MRLAQVVVRAANDLHPLVGGNAREFANGASVSWKEWHPDIVAACVQVLGEVSERLWSVAAAVHEQDRWRVRGAAQLEWFSAGDDSFRVDRKSPDGFIAEAQGATSYQNDRSGYHNGNSP